MLESKATLYLIAALLVGGLGWVLFDDQPGLRVEYFPLTPSWEGAPVYVGVGEPQVAEDKDLAALFSKEIFSVRWRGWLVVDVRGEYRLHIETDEGSYLSIDGEKQPDVESRVFLEQGLHSIDIGYYQTRRQNQLRTLWTPPGEEAALLPIERLHASRPVYFRHLLRRAMAPLAVKYRRLVAALAVLAAIFLLQASWRLSGFELLRPGKEKQRPKILEERTPLLIALLAGLFVACWIWTTRFTTPVMGGDDVLYLHKALFPAKGQWFYNRYVHVYLLKAFVWLRDGDGFLGSRTYWSFTFSVTVAALAIACYSLGPRLQLRTLAVALFLLVSQTSLFARTCGGFADFSCMMFVTVAVAVYLHGLSNEERLGRHGWHELAIGALTVAACKSKETGIILAWLPLLFLWTGGRIDLRGFARKMAHWAAGVASAWLVLMSLDGWLLGDFWYSVKPDFAAMKRLHVNQPMQLERSITRWVKTAWSPNTEAASHALRYLWLLGLFAPIVAAIKRKRAEQCILFLMPLVYFTLLIAVHTRARHIFSDRYFFTILPVCCLAAAATFNFLGLEERSSKKLLQPRVLAPLLVASIVLLLLVNPVRAEEFRPDSGAEWAAFWIACLVVVGAIVSLVRRKSWPALMVILLLVLFGPGFARVQQILAPRLLAQRGELILYPWNSFRHELEAAQPETIVVAPELWRVYRMVGQKKTREQIAQIFFRREDLRMWQYRHIGPDVDYAIAGPYIFNSWRRQVPGLKTTAVYDPSGRLALVQPKAVLQATTD